MNLIILKHLRIEENIQLISIDGSKCMDMNGLFSEFSKKMNFQIISVVTGMLLMSV